MDNKCAFCDDNGVDFYGVRICEACKSQLGLFSDETIKKHIAKFAEEKGPRTYEEEINYRLDYIEKDYLKKKLKLQYILERIKSL